MREILSRGKTDMGGWVEGSLILAENYCCILENEEDVHPMDYPYLNGEYGFFDGKATPVIRETVGVFTGLQDKNCRKVFEDDIVKYKNNTGIKYNGVEVIITGKVVYNEKTASFAVCGRDEIGARHYDYFPIKDVEIIGNIHDNPGMFGGDDR